MNWSTQDISGCSLVQASISPTLPKSRGAFCSSNHVNVVNRLAKDKIVDADGSLLLYEALGGKARGFGKLRLTKYGEP